MLKMEYFFVKFWRSRSHPTVTSAGMREGRATQEQLPSQNLARKSYRVSILSVRSSSNCRI